MTHDTKTLTPATHDDLQHALSFALRFDGRKRWHHADEVMAGIVAQHLIDYLEKAGFVVMKKPPIDGHGRAPGRV